MKRLIYSFFVIICMAAPALACEPPDFPKPEDVAQLEMIESRKGELTDVEKATLETYRADREHFTELYDQAYPCPYIAGEGVPRVQAINSDEMVVELTALKDKWNRSESLPDQAPPPDSEEYIDVPDEEMMTVE